ncbi:MAG: DUF1576 domain-containing protein, partial [Spirochaetia bacterium]|nr:DUF1576 domain-containing protein [Spirochaetia bacterium]
MQRNERILYALVTLLISTLAVTGILLEGPWQVIRQTLSLQTESARLINDFT